MLIFIYPNKNFMIGLVFFTLLLRLEDEELPDYFFKVLSLDIFLGKTS